MSINTMGTTDTYRWDTVFAIRVEDVNKSIIAAKTSPPDFAYANTEGLQINGTFGTWQITTGGDGKTVRFAIPIISGKLVLNEITKQFENISAVVELELDFFENTSHPPGKNGGSFHDLKIRTLPRADKNKVASVLGITSPQDHPSFLIEAQLPTALENWLNNHLDIFDHVFATVNLGIYIANGQFTWVMPTATDYAFSSKETAEDSILGVLCMTENRPIDNLVPQLSPYALPQGQRAGYLVSNERYLQKLLKPAMPFTFAGLKETDMMLSTDQQSLELVNPQGVTLPTVHEGTTYNSAIEALTISIEDKYLQIYYRASTYIGWGVTSHCESTHRYLIKTQNKTNGKSTLIYVSEGDPLFNHWTTQDSNPITTIIIAIIGVILTVVLGYFTAGAGFIAGALVIGLLTGLAIEAPTIVAVVGTDDAPELDLLVLNATDPIVWGGQDHFQLGTASFNGCLQLGGTFIPK